MFDSLTIQDARPIVWLRRVFAFVIVVLLAIGMVSAYRAYIQVRALELNAPTALSVGSIVQTSLMSSGRTTVDVEVDLVQGAYPERLIELGFLDPRTRRGSESATLTAQTLAHFQPGRARLRAVATGRHQWFRLPPPTVRELDVEIRE
jgi:hypothetical protein